MQQHFTLASCNASTAFSSRRVNVMFIATNCSSLCVLRGETKRFREKQEGGKKKKKKEQKKKTRKEV